jgi:hypothetical protein
MTRRTRFFKGTGRRKGLLPGVYGEEATIAKHPAAQPARRDVQEQNGEPVYVSRVNREWTSKPSVLDIALAQGDNRFLVKLTNVSG